MINKRIAQLINYGITRGLIEPEDQYWARNGILSVLGLDSYQEPEELPGYEAPLEEILKDLLDDAEARGVIPGGVTSRDLMDTKLMAFLTPRPSQVIEKFWDQYRISPQMATEWYYDFSRYTDYIRSYRVIKDMKWVAKTGYGDLDITINLSKPEKDPRAIAAAKLQKSVGYPKCLLCREAEGYVGRMDYPGRANHRIIPLKLNGENYFLQYSPYVYYNEHCIVLNEQHVPMKIDRATFQRLLDFVRQFPHYFLGSNADLPIVGGSILSHDHFQGGRYRFAMEKAPVERELVFPGFEDVQAGIVCWPMSVIRLRCADSGRIVQLADRILTAWRGYTDASVSIYAQTEGEPHNTITPIARRRGEDFEMDLVLRNNLTTQEHPLGLFHPHAELHHIKKENIGLIEVMGLAVLPARLKDELAQLAALLCSGGDLYADEATAKHAPWAEELKTRHDFSKEDAEAVLRQEVGQVFMQVLEDAGVFKRDEAGQAAFLRFAESVR
ncbi:MAG: UDP-glucose--hexose-1-phosphate uridylyltransferase [Candidatus Limivicinus sp.]